MKLLPYPQLPLFNEITEVIRTSDITSWQVNDFLKKSTLGSVLHISNANYQNIYGLVHRLVNDGYLTIDSEKNEMGYSTYSETLKMQKFRKQFCKLEEASLLRIEHIYLGIKDKLQILKDDIDAINELKDELPELSFELDDLHTMKTKEIHKQTNKLNLLTQVLIIVSKSKG